MRLEEEIALCATQEERLMFTAFDNHTAWDLGCRMKALAESRGQRVAIEIYLAGAQLFLYAMAGTNPGNPDWVRRKRNVTMRMHKSSYAVGLLSQQMGQGFNERTGLPVADYAAMGGCFPIRVAGCGVIGSVGVSGLPARDDHSFVVDAVAAHLGIDPASVALPPA